MPQYVVKLNHPPDQCPLANSKVRERVVKFGSEQAQLAQEMGVKFLAGPFMLPAEHESIAVVEADRVEAVQNFILRSGLAQWNTVRVSPAVPMAELLKDMDKNPPPLY